MKLTYLFVFLLFSFPLLAEEIITDVPSCHNKLTQIAESNTPSSMVSLRSTISTLVQSAINKYTKFCKSYYDCKKNLGGCPTLEEQGLFYFTQEHYDTNGINDFNSFDAFNQDCQLKACLDMTHSFGCSGTVCTTNRDGNTPRPIRTAPSMIGENSRCNGVENYLPCQPESSNDLCTACKLNNPIDQLVSQYTCPTGEDCPEYCNCRKKNLNLLEQQVASNSSPHLKRDMEKAARHINDMALREMGENVLEEFLAQNEDLSFYRNTNQAISSDESLTCINDDLDKKAAETCGS